MNDTISMGMNAIGIVVIGKGLNVPFTAGITKIDAIGRMPMIVLCGPGRLGDIGDVFDGRRFGIARTGAGADSVAGTGTGADSVAGTGTGADSVAATDGGGGGGFADVSRSRFGTGANTGSVSFGDFSVPKKGNLFMKSPIPIPVPIAPPDSPPSSLSSCSFCINLYV